MRKFFLARATPFESHLHAYSSPPAPAPTPMPIDSQYAAPSQQDIPACITRTVEGDVAAFRAIVDQYGAVMLNTAVMIMGDRDMGEDVVQNALIEAWKHLGELRDPGALRAWLLRIVVNECNSFRRQFARKAALARQMLREHEIDHASRLADADKGRIEGDWDLARAVERLPIKQRTVIVLHYYNGMRLPEMAANLNVSENTLKKRIQVALANLRRILYRPEIPNTEATLRI